MKKRTLLLHPLFLCTLLLLSACVSSTNYREDINAWVGQSVNQLLAAWGPPNTTYRAPNGNLFYIYKNVNVTHFPRDVVPGRTIVKENNGTTVVETTPPHAHGGQTIRTACQTWFETHNNRIIHVNFKGNGCVS